MKNKLTDLNNYLFESIERLTDDSLTDDQLNGAIVNVAKLKSVIHNKKRGK